MLGSSGSWVMHPLAHPFTSALEAISVQYHLQESLPWQQCKRGGPACRQGPCYRGRRCLTWLPRSKRPCCEACWGRLWPIQPAWNSFSGLVGQPAHVGSNADGLFDPTSLKIPMEIATFDICRAKNSRSNRFPAPCDSKPAPPGADSWTRQVRPAGLDTHMDLISGREAQELLQKACVMSKIG